MKRKPALKPRQIRRLSLEVALTLRLQRQYDDNDNALGTRARPLGRHAGPLTAPTEPSHSGPKTFLADPAVIQFP